MADELVPAKPETQAIATIPELPDWLGLHKQTSISTFDTKTENGLRLLTKMGVGCDVEISECTNKEIDIVSWYMAPYERLNTQTGELQNLVFIGIVDANGVTYQSSSIGIRKSLLMLARELGFKPWVPAVRVVVKSIKLQVGNYFALEFVSRVEPNAKPKGK